jgi:kynurenine formamidase
MADGSVQDVYYNGFTGDEILGAYGMRQLGIEEIRPIVTRGILIDVAGYKKVERLPNGYEVTVEDVRGALRRPDPDLAFPVHRELLTQNGIFNLENLKLEELAAEGLHEFPFVYTPVPFKGATGSPGRPLAIR